VQNCASCKSAQFAHGNTNQFALIFYVGEQAMNNTSMVQIVSGVLFFVVLVILVQRRRSRAS